MIEEAFPAVMHARDIPLSFDGTLCGEKGYRIVSFERIHLPPSMIEAGWVACEKCEAKLAKG